MIQDKAKYILEDGYDITKMLYSVPFGFFKKATLCLDLISALSSSILLNQNIDAFIISVTGQLSFKLSSKIIILVLEKNHVGIII